MMVLLAEEASLPVSTFEPFWSVEFVKNLNVVYVSEVTVFGTAFNI